MYMIECYTYCINIPVPGNGNKYEMYMYVGYETFPFCTF